jgi:indole-3-glycerol phosphate synthase
MGFLDQIVAHKKNELEERKRLHPLPVPGTMTDTGKAGRFRSALRRDFTAIIAEIKRRSPSRGLIREDFRPAEIALAYAGAGADAVSVLTDERFFGGSETVFRSVRQTIGLPLLRKDFIFDAYQLVESRLMLADAVLLIARILDAPRLGDLIRTAGDLGLDALVEVRDESDLEKALEAGAGIIGVNNRDLETFQVDLGVSMRLAKLLPENAVSVSESGIRTREDVLRLGDAGFDAVLVGESLMREPDSGAALAALKGGADAS